MIRIVPALLMASTLLAQNSQPRKSPHETVSATIGGKQISLTYGRPYLKGRKAVGGELVPYGQVWRLGADEATVLKTDAAIDLGGLTLQPGSYALFTLPSASGWKLIVNKKSDQWGLDHEKNQADDIGQVALNVGRSNTPVEQFTMSVQSAGERTGMLKFMWENTVCDVPIILK